MAERRLRARKGKEVTEQAVERVWGPAIEIELYIEGVNLRCLEMKVEAATEEYNNMLDLMKKSRCFNDRALLRRKTLVEARVRAYERELARVQGGGHIDEEEAIIAWMDGYAEVGLCPEQMEDRLASYVAPAEQGEEGDANDPGPFEVI